MNSADLITSFFNNEMSPDQEREFLLSVASSDSMRLGLKSHVILDKILVDDSNGAKVPQQVRQRVFHDAAIVAAGLGSGEGVSEHTDATDRAPVEARHAGRTGSFVRMSSRWVVGILTLMLCSGSFFAGYSIAEDDQQQTHIGVVTSDTDAADRMDAPTLERQDARSAQHPMSFDDGPEASTARENRDDRNLGASSSVRDQSTRASRDVENGGSAAPLASDEHGASSSETEDTSRQGPPGMHFPPINQTSPDDSEESFEE